MSVKRSMGSKEFMNKTIPRNPKYGHVKTKLDTGCSYTKYMERQDYNQKNFNYRNDEIFKRLKLMKFAQMILQVASAADLNENEIDSESHNPGDRQDARAEDVCCAERSTLLRYRAAMHPGKHY